ncbi:MAG: general secretion pathway protein GspK [Planctomycetes bacterium]|nr:general secretion pathway protein GspK [Planctomycetota bacterium]
MTQIRPGQRQDGFILIVVLGVVLVLCGLLFSFSQTTRTSLAKADGFYRTEQAWNAAWGGLQIAVATIRDVNAVCADPQSAKLTTSENTFTIGDVNCTVVITEENGLLNVNRLKGADGQLDRKHIEQFLRLIDVVNHQQKDSPPIGYGLVPAVIDWVDSDNDITCLPFVQRDNTGAENDDYQMDTPPRSCRNGPVDILEDLLGVKGMTPESFGRLRPYLTCVGDGKIDINAAPKVVLQSLSEQIDAPLAETIVRQRKLKPFKSLAELGSVPGMTDNICRDIQNLITINPAERFYRVRSQGNIQEHRCTMEAELQRNTQAGTVDILQYREL